MPCGDFGANAVFFRLGALAYNLFVLFKLLALSVEWRRYRVQTLAILAEAAGTLRGARAECAYRLPAAYAAAAHTGFIPGAEAALIGAGILASLAEDQRQGGQGLEDYFLPLRNIDFQLSECHH